LVDADFATCGLRLSAGFSSLVYSLPEPVEAVGMFSAVERLEKEDGLLPDADTLAGLVIGQWMNCDWDSSVASYQRLIASDESFADAEKVKARDRPQRQTEALLAALGETLRRHPDLVPRDNE
jgi:hypothetical protein